MSDFATKSLPEEVDAIGPDGLEVRLLLGLDSGTFAHFTLPAGKTSQAVTHKTVEEIWYFLSGVGEMWRRQGDRESIDPVSRGVCLSVPLETHFQFRNTGTEPLTFIIATMPPWPGDGEAFNVPGKWPAADE